MKVSERVKTEMRTYQRHFQASVLFATCRLIRRRRPRSLMFFCAFAPTRG